MECLSGLFMPIMDFISMIMDSFMGLFTTFEEVKEVISK